MESVNDSKPRVKVFTPPSFEGVTSVAILEEIIDEDIELDVRYVRHLDFREYEQFKEAEVILVIGLAYQGYALPDYFHVTVDVPFMDFIHCATFGEPLPGEHIISTVEEGIDPIKSLCTFLETNIDSSILSKYLNITDKARYMIEAVNAYRTWAWDRNDTTRVLLSLYNATYKRLPMLVRGLTLKELVRHYAPVIKGQIEKQKDYINRKRETLKQYSLTLDGTPCILKVVFAEEYINELANALLNDEADSATVIVCVGRTTKSSDIMSIRTKNIHAGQVAKIINRGSGKESVATVFSGVGYAELIGNSVVSKLSQIAD